MLLVICNKHHRKQLFSSSVRGLTEHGISLLHKALFVRQPFGDIQTIMNFLSNDISPKILAEQLLYFRSSLSSYSENYYKIVFKHEEVIEPHLVYVCPLCLKNFLLFTKERQYGSSLFNLDHIPPESVGGTLELMMCEPCNNRAGTSFEYELKAKMKFEASKLGYVDNSIEARFETSSLTKPLKSYLSKDNKGQIHLDFAVEAKEKNPFLITWLDETSKTDDWEVKLTIRMPDDKKVFKAVLKSAYLICFINWGYDFVFSTNAALIRQVLNDEREYPLKFTSFWFDHTNLSKEVKLPLGLCRIEKPMELKTFVVNLPLKYNDYESIVSVMIPYSGDEGVKKLSDIDVFQKAGQTFDVTFKQEAASLANYILDGYSKSKQRF